MRVVGFLYFSWKIRQINFYFENALFSSISQNICQINSPFISEYSNACLFFQRLTTSIEILTPKLKIIVIISLERKLTHQTTTFEDGRNASTYVRKLPIDRPTSTHKKTWHWGPCIKSRRTDRRTVGRRWMEAAAAGKITPHQKTWKTEKRHVKTESELCSLLLPQIRILATFSPGYFFSKKLVDKNLIIVPKLLNRKILVT